MDIRFMELALREAENAFELGEVPVGAVITKNGELVSKAHNRRETGKNALYHAETEAIFKACEALGGWRLWECEMYITLEPCPMCAGAIVNARIPKVYFGAFDSKNGAACSAFKLFETEHNFRPGYTGGIMEDECSKLIRDFFTKLRNSR